MPHIEMSERHIENLKVVLNRQALLSFMPIDCICAEVGVWRGDFSSHILSITKPRKLYLIDKWSDEVAFEDLDAMGEVKKRFEEEITSQQVIIRQGLSVDVLEEFPDDYLDWVYLDSEHSYETIHNELEICRRKVKNTGIIAGHDYVIGSWNSQYRYGVIEAVAEFCTRYDWEMIYLTHEEHRHLSYALSEISKDRNNSSICIRQKRTALLS
jgi:hypothetical protein